MNRFLKSTTIFAAATLLLSSCSKDNDENSDYSYSVEKTAKDYFSIVTDASNNITYVGGAEMGFLFDYGNKKATVSLRDVASGPASKSTYTLSNVPFAISSQASKKITDASGDGISDVNIEFWDAYVEEDYFPIVVASYKVGSCKVTLSPYVYYYCYSTTSVTTTESAPDFVDTQIIYRLTLKPDQGTADLRLFGAKFSAQMPMRLNMDFPDIPLTLKSDGSFTLQAASIEPTINGVPYPQFAILNLSASGGLKSNMTLRFTVQGQGSVTATMKRSYDI